MDDQQALAFLSVTYCKVFLAGSDARHFGESWSSGRPHKCRDTAADGNA